MQPCWFGELCLRRMTAPTQHRDCAYFLRTITLPIE